MLRITSNGKRYVLTSLAVAVVLLSPPVLGNPVHTGHTVHVQGTGANTNDTVTDRKPLLE